MTSSLPGSPRGSSRLPRICALRRRNGVEELVSTWVGFEDDEPRTENGEPRPTGRSRNTSGPTTWPNPATSCNTAYLPMVGPDKKNLRPDPARERVDSRDHPQPRGHAADRGVLQSRHRRGAMGVATSWITDRREGPKLRKVIDTPGDPFRDYLAGPLGKRLFELLDSAAKDKREIYAALYELDDEQLEAALDKIGSAHTSCLPTAASRKKGRTRTVTSGAAARGDRST